MPDSDPIRRSPEPNWTARAYSSDADLFQRQHPELDCDEHEWEEVSEGRWRCRHCAMDRRGGATPDASRRRP